MGEEVRVYNWSDYIDETLFCKNLKRNRHKTLIYDSLTATKSA